MALYVTAIVVTDVAFNHPNQFLLAGKMPYRIVVNAVSHTRHALCHPGLLKLVLKYPAGVLKPSVTMEQWVSVRIGFDSLVKGFVNERVIIALTDHVGHDATVAKIQNSAQIELVHRSALIPF